MKDEKTRKLGAHKKFHQVAKSRNFHIYITWENFEKISASDINNMQSETFFIFQV